jgi:hypothetical protein
LPPMEKATPTASIDSVQWTGTVCFAR